MNGEGGGGWGGGVRTLNVMKMVLGDGDDHSRPDHWRERERDIICNVLL